MSNFNYRQEIDRKLIHLSSLWMPAGIWFLDKPIILVFFVAVFLIITVFEIMRRQNNPVGRRLGNLFANVLRPSEASENKKLTGAFYMLLGAIITTLFAPKEVAVTALTVLIISDSLAALVGRRWGSHEIGQKSLEGGAAFYFSALVITFCFALIDTSSSFRVFFASGNVASFVAMLCELYASRLKLDDNLVVPVSFAATQFYVIMLINHWGIV